MPYHCLKRLQNTGTCGALKGNLLLYYIYTDEPGYAWTEQEMEKQRYKRKVIMSMLESEAAKDHVPLMIYNLEKRLIMKTPFEKKRMEEIRERFAKLCGYPSLKHMHDALLQEYEVDQIAFVFLFRKEGRSGAYSAGAGQKDYCESLMLFGGRYEKLCHELLHLFGAVDYYFPDEVKLPAGKLFPDSVMLDSANRCIDELTRYLIGWHAAPSPKARQLLDATAHITKEQFDRALQEQWNADYTTVHYENSVYTGPIRDGLRHGEGVLQFHEGQRYEGMFVRGNYHGKGKLTYANGAVYEGDFENGVRSGWGRLVYGDGKTVYEGEFKNGKCDGQGTLTFPGGTVQKGRFHNDVFLG